MFQSNEHKLKEIINELIHQYRLTGKLNELKLIKSWEVVAGPMIKKHTLDLKVKNSKLFVKLDSPALRNELSYSRQKLIDLLNKEAGDKIISDIIFT